MDSLTSDITESSAQLSNEESGLNPNGPDTRLLIKEEIEEIDDLRVENKILQRRVLALQTRRSSIGTKFFLDGVETQYKNRLMQWSQTKHGLDQLIHGYDDKIDRMQEHVREKQHEASLIREDFLAFKWQVAQEAEHNLTRKKIKENIVEKMHVDDRSLDSEIEKLRIQGRQLTSQLKKMDQALWKKDQLPGSFHLVDYEQLKIESESVNEKLTQKNEKLSKLRQKTTHMVHVLSHLREKLQYIQKENQMSRETQDVLESDLLTKRKELHQIKRCCKELQFRKEKLQANVVKIANPMLLDDMEMNKENIEDKEKKLKNLKLRYDTLIMSIKKHKDFISRDSQENSSPLRSNLIAV